MLRSIVEKLKFLLPAVVMAAAWELAARLLPNGTFLFGSPSAILKVASVDLQSIQIYKDIAVTSSETLVGLGLGAFCGTLLGLGLWVSSRLGRIFQPYIIILGSIPVVALGPLLITWFGTGFWSKAVLAAFSTLLVAATQAFEGAKAADVERLEFAKALRATRWQMVRTVIFPGAVVWVIAGIRLSVGFAIIGAFIGEFVSSQYGVGHYIVRFGGIYDIPRVLFGVMILGALALAITGTAYYVIRWRAPAYLQASFASFT